MTSDSVTTVNRILWWVMDPSPDLWKVDRRMAVMSFIAYNGVPLVQMFAWGTFLGWWDTNFWVGTTAFFLVWLLAFHFVVRRLVAATSIGQGGATAMRTPTNKGEGNNGIG